MKTTAKFDGLEKLYTASRPDYSPALIDCMYQSFGLSETSVIADIGSGTGKLSKLMLEQGSEVFGIEPNDGMRATAEKELRGYSRFHSVCGCADNTELMTGGVNAVTVAQAFHWFEPISFRRECHRILKDSGYVFLIWNIRDAKDQINCEWSEIFSRYCPNFNGFSNGIKNNDPTVVTFFENGYKRIEFDFPLTFEKNKFINRSLSSSYSLKPTDPDYPQYLLELQHFFDKHSKNGTLKIKNSTVAYIGKIK